MGGAGLAMPCALRPLAPMVRAPARAMRPLAQDSAATCWYACFAMLFTWAGHDPGVIRERLVAAGIPWDDAVRSGLRTRDYLPAARALGLQPRGSGTSWTAADIRSWLSRSPAWVAGRWHPEYGHNVLVTAANDEVVEYIDPWGDGQGRARVMTARFETFVKGPAPDAPGTDYYRGWLGAVMHW